MYTYRFANLLADSDIAELDLEGVRFDRRIIVPGSFSASVTVTNPVTANEVRKIIPGKTVVHVYRNADIWGTYIIWQKRVRSGRGSAVVDISGATLESWFYRRILDYPDLTYVNEDQISILGNLVSLAQVGWPPYEESANLSIEVPDGTSGVLRDRVYDITEATSVGQRIEELANVDDGFEYMINTHDDYVNGVRPRVLNWGYPRLNDVTRNITYEYPGNIISYEFSYDTTESGTAFWARGDSIETDGTENGKPLMTTSPVLATEYLDAGWPHLDVVADYSGVTDIDTLEKYAIWWRTNRSGLVSIPSITIHDDDATFNPSFLGASVTFVIHDEYFSIDNQPAFSGTYRIVGMEVSPPQRGDVETVRFVVVDEFDPTEV